MAECGLPSVSLNVIARDEEANLGSCLGPVRDLVDEVVVVDTGSVDRTREVARSLGARVVEFPWCDDFAAARNAALDHSSGDYVLWLDADDRIDPPNRDRLAALIAGLGGEPAAFAATCRCVPAAPGEPAARLDHVRLFSVLPGVRWAGRVHEQIGPSLLRNGVVVRRTDLVIDHLGYADPHVRRRKLDRDRRLLGLELAERPADPFVRYNLGATLLAAGHAGEAVGHLAECVRLYTAGHGMLARTYARLAEGLRQLGDRTGAWRACAAGRAGHPGDRDLTFLEGVLLSEDGDWAGAASAFEWLVATAGPGADDWGDFARAGHNLAMAYVQLGKPDAAAGLWGRVLAREPEYRAAWIGLGELAVARGDWPTAVRAADALSGLGDDLAATVLRVRAYLGCRDFDAARQELVEGLRRQPADLRLRLLRSHLCVLEGRDWAEAEAALLAVLEVAPEHPEALKNLAAVRRLRAEGR